MSVVAVRRKYLIGIVAVLVVAAGLSGVLAWRHLYAARLLPLDSANGSIVDLGFTYVAVTKNNNSYYDLAPASGALVTSVNRGSLAEEVGLKTGDLILSLNGIALDGNTSLLGLIRGCPADSRVTLLVQDAAGQQNILLCSPAACSAN